MTIARLPYEAAVGAEIDHTYDTAVSEGVGGRSGRLSQRRALIRQFHLTIGPDQVDEVIAIHATHRRRWPVGVRNWGNYQYADEVLAWTEDTSSVYAPLRRTVTAGDRYAYQRILIPDETEVATVIKVDGVPLSESDWTMMDFGIPKIPIGLVSEDSVITATGRDLVAACFMDDVLTEKVHRAGLRTLPDVRLREILEPELIALMAQTPDNG